MSKQRTFLRTLHHLLGQGLARLLGQVLARLLKTARNTRNRFPPRGFYVEAGMKKNHDFRPIFRFISQTVQDIAMVKWKTNRNSQATADMDTFTRPFVHCILLVAMATPRRKMFITVNVVNL